MSCLKGALVGSGVVVGLALLFVLGVLLLLACYSGGSYSNG